MGDEVSIIQLRDAIVDFWTNANEGDSHKSFATSNVGCVDLQEFVLSAPGKLFLTNCLVDLRVMKADLEQGLVSCGVREEDFL